MGIETKEHDAISEKLSRKTNSVICDNFSVVYKAVLSDINVRGTEFNSRSGYTKEICDYKTIINNPLKRCVGGYNRDINIFFLIAEAAWIINGRNDVEYLDPYLNVLKKYSDNGVYYHGAYGKRINGQLCKAIDLLKKEPGTRRAVLQIWDKELDLGTESEDLPCNTMLFLNIRDGKLNVTVSNRSNDINKGLCTNIFQFSLLQEYIAISLGVDVGTLVHNSASLHYYTNDDITKRVLAYKGGYKRDFDFYNVYDLSVDRLGIKAENLKEEFENFIDVTKPDSEKSYLFKSELMSLWADMLCIYRDKTSNEAALILLYSLSEKYGEKLFKNPYYILAANRFVKLNGVKNLTHFHIKIPKIGLL